MIFTCLPERGWSISRGWDMPIIYRSIIDEHEQTRNSGSIFDVSHMGRLYFSGPDAQRFLDKVLDAPDRGSESRPMSLFAGLQRSGRRDGSM